jgi:3-phosphoshikimate 1-carboxyvinyltransferase
MLTALRELGVPISTHAADSVTVQGVARFPVERAELFMGNAGTAIRPLTAALAMMGGHYTLSGVPRMHERPIGDLVDGLRGMGACLSYLGQDGYPPLHIEPAGTLLDRVAVQGSVSSQFLTAVLMAAPLAVARSGKALVIDVVGELISKPYIEITLNLMARFGVTVERHGWQQFVVPVGSAYRSPQQIHVEGDASSASYFLALGAIGVGQSPSTASGRKAFRAMWRLLTPLKRWARRSSAMPPRST